MSDLSKDAGPGDADQQTSGYAWYVVVVLMLAAALSLVDRLLVGQLVEPLRRNLGISDFQVSLLQGFAFSLPFAIAGIPIGRFVDRSIRRNIVAAGITFWSLMTAAGGFATSYWHLFLSRAGVGIGEAALGPAAYSIISDYFKRSRIPLAIAVFTLGSAIGSGLSFVVGSVISGIASRESVQFAGGVVVEGWKAAFILVGLPGLVVAALVLTVREPTRRGLAGDQPARVADVLTFLRERRRLATCYVIGIGSAFSVTYALLAWLTSFYIRVHGASPAEVGGVLGATILIMSAAGIFAGGYVSARLLRREVQDATLRTAAVAMTLALPFLIAAPLVDSRTLSLVLFAPAILLSSVLVSLGTSTIQLVTPNEMRGQVSALGLMLTTVLGSVLGPGLVAACTDFVFADEKAIGTSLVLVCATMGVTSITALVFALRPLRDAIALSRKWSGQ